MARRQHDILDRLIDCFSVRGILLHQATLSCLATVALIGGVIFLWDANHEKITQLAEYQLTEENIILPPVPQWADQDLRQLVLDSSPNETTSILDTQLVSRTAGVMKSVGFVETVRSVDKSKNQLKIDLVYRRPVAVVELSETTFPARPNASAVLVETALVPVDRLGVLMPENIADQQWLPKIFIPFPAHHENRTTWQAWPDERIQDAAAISSLFEDSAKTIGLAWIVSKRHPQVHEKENAPFELWPDKAQGTIIIWGNAPGKESDGEASVENKLKVLDELIAAYGPLSNTVSRRVDIRTGIAVPQVETKTAANSKSVFANFNFK